MTICFKNESFFSIDVCVNKSHITIPCDQTYIYTAVADHIPIEIKFSIADKEAGELQNKDNCFNISTCILLEFDDSVRSSLIIKKETKRFQNHTQYQYLIVDAFNADIQEAWHLVDNYEGEEICVSGQKKHYILHIIKKSFIDTLLEGFF